MNFLSKLPIEYDQKKFQVQVGIPHCLFFFKKKIYITNLSFSEDYLFKTIYFIIIGNKNIFRHTKSFYVLKYCFFF